MNAVTQQHKTSLLNKRLLQLMQEKNLNVNTLAQKTHIPIDSLQKILNDPTVHPSIDSLKAICKALEVPNSYLIELAQADIPLLNWHTVADVINNDIAIFALTITESSTIFPPQTVLIFDKSKPYYHGCYVLAQLNSSQDYDLKKLIIHTGHLYVKSINLAEDSSLIRIEKNQILATLAQAIL